MPIVRKWKFFDPSTNEGYIFAVSPNADGSPQYEKSITYSNTAAPDGLTLMFEGRDNPLTLSFSGTLLTQEQYQAFVTWFKKRHQILITDDLERQFMCYITKFAAKRERAVHYPWKHSYTCEATILDWDVAP